MKDRVCLVLGGLQRGKMEGQCQMARSGSPEPNNCKCTSLLCCALAARDCKWKAKLLLPCQAVAVAVPCLHSLSTYRLNLSEGKETKAQLFMIMWAEQQGASCLTFLQFRGPVSVRTFVQSVFQG